METPYDYHSDESKHGGYQYLTLKEVVDDINLERFDDDSILKNTSRYIIIRICLGLAP